MGLFLSLLNGCINSEQAAIKYKKDCLYIYIKLIHSKGLNSLCMYVLMED